MLLPRAGARRLRPRSTDVPHGLGVDDAALGHGDPRCSARRQAVAADGVQLPRGHPPRRGRDLDRSAAPGECGRVRRCRRDQLRFGTADRDRPCGSGGDGDEGRRDAAARLAPARSSDRAGAGFGAHERRDDQGCAVRARARARRVGRRSSGLVRRAGARRRRPFCGGRRRLRAVSARSQAAAGPALDRERRDHRARARRLPDPACSRRRLLGRLRTRCRAPAHRQPRRLQVAALPRRRCVRAGGRLARARPDRRPSTSDAVDRRGIPGRCDGDRRPPAAERLCLGMVDAAGAAARCLLRARRGRDRRGGRPRRPGRDRRPRALLLRQGRGACAAWAAAERRGCGGRRGAAADAGCAVVLLGGVCIVLGLAPDSSSDLSLGSRPGRLACRPRPASSFRGQVLCRRFGSRSCSSG